jgi:adenosylhomocysteine nucleosidase
MRGTIAIIAALPGELKPLVSPPDGIRWQRLKADKGTVLWERKHDGGRWVAGCSGMGGARATLTLKEIERYAAADVICSIGWAGAIDLDIDAATVWRVAQVIDTQTGERFDTALRARAHSAAWPVLATTVRVADAPEKVRLAASYGARLVDMEAATLARIAQARGIPFFCFKAVSDAADARVPDFNRFMMDTGRLRMVPFLAHVAVRPGSWQELARLGRYSSLAARHLATAVQSWLDGPANG